MTANEKQLLVDRLQAIYAMVGELTPVAIREALYKLAEDIANMPEDPGETQERGSHV